MSLPHKISLLMNGHTTGEQRMSSVRDVVSVEITARARKRLRQISVERGMIHKQLGGRVIEWFTDLTPLEQELVVQSLGRDREFLSEMLIRRKVADLSGDREWAFREPIQNLLRRMPGSSDR